MKVKTARMLLAATLAAASAALAASPASAIPDPTATVAAARIDAQIKPRFGKLLRPPLHRWRPWAPRWRYGRWWNPIWRDGRWCYEYEFLPEYAGVVDEYGARDAYPYDPYGYPPGQDPYYGATGYGVGGYGSGLYGGGRLVGPDYPGAIYTGPVLGPSYPVGGGPYPGPGGGYIGGGFGPDGKPRRLTPEERWGGPQSLRVDCSGHGGLSLQEAVDQVGEGGTVYIRGAGGSCRFGVEITHSMSLVGEERSAFDPGGPGPVAITAPLNGPCVRIMPSVRRVELRNLLIESGQGGRAACVQSFGSELAIVQTTIRYTGEGCAVYAGGGRLLLREAVIDADTPDTAVFTDGASVDAKQVRIRSRGTGMDIAAGGPAGVHLDHVTVHTLDGGAPRGEVGVIVRGRGGAETDVRNTVIDGYRIGAWMERGGQVSLTADWIGRSELGVVSDGANLTVQDSVIAARDVGVYVMTGKALITHNRIVDFTDTPIDADRFADVTVEENWIYPAGGCGPFGGWRGWCRGRGGFGLHLNVGVGLSFGWEGAGFDYPDGYRRGDDHGFDWRRRGGGAGFRGRDYRPPRSISPDRPVEKPFP